MRLSPWLVIAAVLARVGQAQTPVSTPLPADFHELVAGGGKLPYHCQQSDRRVRTTARFNSLANQEKFGGTQPHPGCWNAWW